MIDSAQGCTMADWTIAATYRRQAAECRAAMHAALAGGWAQAAALLAVQAVRSAANGLLAAHAGIAATGRDADPVDLLYRCMAGPSADRQLAAGAEVLAYEEDLRAYGFPLDPADLRRCPSALDAMRCGAGRVPLTARSTRSTQVRSSAARTPISNIGWRSFESCRTCPGLQALAPSAGGAPPVPCP